MRSLRLVLKVVVSLFPGVFELLLLCFVWVSFMETFRRVLGCSVCLLRLPFFTHQVVRYLFVVFARRLPRRLLRPPPGSGEAKTLTLTLTLRVLLRDNSSSSSWTSMTTPPKMKQRGKGGKKLASRTEGRDRGTREGNTRRKLSPKYEQGPSPR